MLIVSVFVAVGMTLALAALGSRSILLAILAPVTTLVLLEVLYRGALLTAYGRHYRFSYSPFLFQDHGRYGNALRPSTRVRDVRFLLFDKYVFDSLPPPSSSVEDNIAARFDVNINSNGYRGPDLETAKRAPLRIFCSGGSTTACYGDDEQTWPSQLQLALARKGLEVEVINGGVWGWTSTQELKRLRDEADELQPDIVLLHQGWNEEFLYSSLRLGATWRPGIVRTLAERELCVEPGALVARVPLVSAYMVGLARKARYFERHMAFTNRRRWRSLLDEPYIEDWVNNLQEFLALATQHSFLLYTVNPPCLVDVGDAREYRELYVRRSRLTWLHAHYQAVSKSRIAKALRVSARWIPCLDAAQRFAAVAGDDRLALFRDELHLTPRGDALLGEHLAAMLATDARFLAAYEGCGYGESDSPGEADLAQWKEDTRCVDPKIARLVASIVSDLKDGRPIDPGDIPEDMYSMC